MGAVPHDERVGLFLVSTLVEHRGALALGHGGALQIGVEGDGGVLHATGAGGLDGGLRRHHVMSLHEPSRLHNTENPGPGWPL